MTTKRDESRESWEWDLRNQLYLEEQQIKKALKGIDRAREKLIDAQNVLANVVKLADDITRKTLDRFYDQGGVTAADWQDWADNDFFTSDQDAKIARRGKLRLIQSKKEGEQKVTRYRPQTIDDNGPEAA